MEEWKPEEVTAHLDYYRALHRELVDSGELVESEVLAGPDLAKIVTSDGGAPVVTDGPFQEFKEWVAGYQIVDVESEARAIEIAAQALGRAGTGRRRRSAADPGAAGDGPRPRRTSPRWRRSSSRRAGALSEPPLSRTCCASWRRRSSARWSAARATSTPPRTPSRRRCSRPPSTGRATVSREPARLADADRRAPADRPVAERPVAAGPGGASRSQQETAVDVPDRDDTLVLLFMCCHPALTPASAIALTLRAVGGLTTAEIASAFLVAEATMAQRISRAKQRIKASDVPFRLPDARRAAGQAARGAARALPDLQRGVHEQQRPRAAAHRALGRGDPADAGWCSGCCPTTPRSTGLLALMLLVDARRPARTDAAGELVPLAEQDRTLWDRGADRARASLSSSARSRRGRSASTSSRRRSRPSTTGLRAPRTPTGRRSSRSTGCSSR